LCGFQLLTADDKHQFHKLLTELHGPINEAVQIADELVKRLRSGESSTSKVNMSTLLHAYIIFNVQTVP